MNRICFNLAAGIVMALGSTAHGAQASWNAVADFNIAANPNGAWSYNWRLPTGPLTLMTFGEHDCNEAGSDCWSRYGGGNWLPQIAKNVSGTEIQNQCCVYPLGILNMHPGASGERAVVTWTAPATGTYMISGQYQIEDYTPTGVEVFVTQGSSVLLDKVLSSFARVAQFHYKRTVTAGEKVSFSVDAHGNYTSDSTAFEVGILLVAVPPAGGDGQATQSRPSTADYGALRFGSGARDYAAPQDACTSQCEKDFQDCFYTGVTYRVCMNERIQCIKDCRFGPAP